MKKCRFCGSSDLVYVKVGNMYLCNRCRARYYYTTEECILEGSWKHQDEYDRGKEKEKVMAQQENFDCWARFEVWEITDEHRLDQPEVGWSVTFRVFCSILWSGWNSVKHYGSGVCPYKLGDCFSGMLEKNSGIGSSCN
jgi:hypothetical protein